MGGGPLGAGRALPASRHTVDHHPTAAAVIGGCRRAYGAAVEGHDARPPAPPALGSPALPVAACEAPALATAPTEQSERQTWMAQVQCEAQSAAMADP